MRVRFSARSDVGLRREVNQDSYGAKEMPGATLLIVCDGMGGHAAGEVASQLAVETIIATFAATDPPDAALRGSFVAANNAIYDQGRGSMGTTGVAAFFVGSGMHVANVGDSRAYMVREGQITQISRDHSFVSDQVAAGLMTAEEARVSNVRNIITRALGYQPEVQVDTFSTALRPGDTVLLSSDGMHGLIEDSEIAEIASMLPPDAAAQRLVDTANARGGHDNITVVIAQVDEVDATITQVVHDEDTLGAPPPDAAAPAAPAAPAPPERQISRLGIILAALTLLVLLGAAGFLLIPPPTVIAPPATSAAATPRPAATAQPTRTNTTATPTTPTPAGVTPTISSP